MYDTNLKLIKADSSAYDYKGTHSNLVLVYDNGYAFIKGSEGKCEVSLTDLKTSKSANFILNNSNAVLTVSKIKAIAGDKIIFLGKYNSKKDKKLTNGIFKAVFNQKINALEEKIFFDHVPAGKGEKDKVDKNVEETVISESGACYALISQGAIPSYSGYDAADKYELVYLNSGSDKWKKQLPISPKTQLAMMEAKGNVYLTYLDYEGDNNKIDVNNYDYGDPTPSTPVTIRQIYKSNISLLKITSNGTIQKQTFPDNYYKDIIPYDSGFIGVQQGLNGQITSKCKFFRISLN